MSVKKIFVTLITIVACVIIGALVLNVLLPNVSTTLVNYLEEMIYKATGAQFDFNNDGAVGQNAGANKYGASQTGGQNADQNAGVDGFN